MTHHLRTDGERRLILDIYPDAERQEIENIVASIWRWHRRQLGDQLRALESTREFDAWCHRQREGVMKTPDIARMVNAELSDLVQEHIRRNGHLEKLVDASGRGQIGFEIFTLQVKTAIDATWPMQTAAALLQLALPRVPTAEIEGWLVEAARNVTDGKPPFDDLYPVDPRTVGRAIARHRRRANC